MGIQIGLEYMTTLLFAGAKIDLAEDIDDDILNIDGNVDKIFIKYTYLEVTMMEKHFARIKTRTPHYKSVEFFISPHSL